jgi:hypothetical protein
MGETPGRASFNPAGTKEATMAVANDKLIFTRAC